MKEYLFSNKGTIARKVTTFICVVICYLLPGCAGHTTVSKTHFYPANKNLSTADFLMQIEVHGENRKAYSDITKKRVIITIWKGEEKLLIREYSCIAASLEWDVVWKELRDLNIVFFDFQKGVSIYDEKAIELPAKQIFSLRFTYDDQVKKFTEYPISQEIVKQAKGLGQQSP